MKPLEYVRTWMGADEPLEKVLERVKFGPVEEVAYWRGMLEWVKDYEAHDNGN